MRPIWSSKLRARSGFWLMLAIAAIGSTGLQLLALQLRGPPDDALVDAVYRYRADALPACEQLLGRSPLALPPHEVEWVRMSGLPPVTSDGKCRAEARLVL